jgi:hypothetical protein
MNGQRIRAGQDVTYRYPSGWLQVSRVASSQGACPGCGATVLLMLNGDLVDPTHLALHEHAK